MSLNEILKQAVDAPPRYHCFSYVFFNPNKVSVPFVPDLYETVRDSLTSEDWWSIRRDLMADDRFVDLARIAHMPGES